jgi:hypothetical protein
VRYRPALLLAILVYVTLDLSLPAMPGAFVFDSSDSVESTRTRARAVGDAVVLPAPLPDGVVPARPRLDARERLTPAESAPRGARRVLIWRSRALSDPAPPSEDPH